MEVISKNEILLVMANEEHNLINLVKSIIIENSLKLTVQIKAMKYYSDVLEYLISLIHFITFRLLKMRS